MPRKGAYRGVNWHEEIEKIVDMRNSSHMTMDEIGHLYGVSRQRIHQVLTSFGYRQVGDSVYRTATERWRKERLPLQKYLIVNGLRTVADIARDEGITKVSMSKRLNAAGIRLRGIRGGLGRSSVIRVNSIICDWNSGYGSIRSIAAKHHVSESTVIRIAEKYNLKGRYQIRREKRGAR